MGYIPGRGGWSIQRAMEIRSWAFLRRMRKVCVCGCDNKIPTYGNAFPERLFSLSVLSVTTVLHERNVRCYLLKVPCLLNATTHCTHKVADHVVDGREAMPSADDQGIRVKPKIEGSSPGGLDISF